MAYPIGFDVSIGDGRRNRLLAALGALAFIPKVLLLIPHLFLLLLYGIVVLLIAWIGYWAVAITGRMPASVRAYELGFLSWASRIAAWTYGTTDTYPSFGLQDPAYPAQVEVAAAPEPQNRLLAVLGIVLVKLLLAIPHLFVLWWLTLGTLALMWIGYLIVLFTGQIPLGLHAYLVRFHQWWVRAWSWIFGLTDEYPPFSLA